MKFESMEDFNQKTNSSIMIRVNNTNNEEDIVYSRGTLCYDSDGKEHAANIKIYSYYAPTLGYLQFIGSPVPVWTYRHPSRNVTLGVNQNNLLSNPSKVFDKQELNSVMKALFRCYKEDYLDIPNGFVTRNYFWNSDAGVLKYMNTVVAKTQGVRELVFESESEMLFHKNVVGNRLFDYRFTYNQQPSLENYQEDFDV